MTTSPPLAAPHLTEGAPPHRGPASRLVAIRLRYRFTLLLITFVLILLIGPPLAIAEPGRIPLNLLTVAQIGVVAWAAAQTRRTRLLMSVLLPLALGASLAQTLGAGLTLSLLATALDSLVVAIAILQILRWSLRQQQVTVEAVQACICAYLLIGLWFTYAYAATEALWRGSILDRGELLADLGGGTHPIHRYLSLHYFSYSTLTTLGYGDILPVHPLARSLTAIEALVGQAYMATLVSFIVGVYISDQARRRDDARHSGASDEVGVDRGP